MATIEPSGQIGVLLFERSQPATKEDIQLLINYLHSKLPGDQIPPPVVSGPTKAGKNHLFNEVKTKGSSQPNHNSLQ